MLTLTFYLGEGAWFASWKFDLKVAYIVGACVAWKTVEYAIAPGFAGMRGEGVGCERF